MGASRYAARSRVRIAVTTRVAHCRSEVSWRLLNRRKDFSGTGSVIVIIAITGARVPCLGRSAPVAGSVARVQCAERGRKTAPLAPLYQSERVK